MLILSNEDIEKILPVGACLDVLEEAYRDLGNGMAATVPRWMEVTGEFHVRGGIYTTVVARHGQRPVDVPPV